MMFISSATLKGLPYMRLIAQRLPGLQRVLDALQRLPLAAQLQERFALEVEQVLLGDGRLVRQRAAGDHVRERASDDRVVIADAAGAPREVDAELQRGEHALAADGNRGARLAPLIAFADALERVRLGVLHQAIAVHRDRIRVAEEPEAPRVGGARRDLREADRDRKSTRLNSSHLVISYAVFCLKKKKPEKRCRPSILNNHIRVNNTPPTQ